MPTPTLKLTNPEQALIAYPVQIGDDSSILFEKDDLLQRIKNNSIVHPVTKKPIHIYDIVFITEDEYRAALKIYFEASDNSVKLQIRNNVFNQSILSALPRSKTIADEEEFQLITKRIEHLLSVGINIDEPITEHHQSALECAIKNSDIQLALFLVHKGAQLKTEFIFWANLFNHPAIEKFLTEKGLVFNNEKCISWLKNEKRNDKSSTYSDLLSYLEDADDPQYVARICRLLLENIDTNPFVRFKTNFSLLEIITKHDLIDILKPIFSKIEDHQKTKKYQAIMFILNDVLFDPEKKEPQQNKIIHWFIDTCPFSYLEKFTPEDETEAFSIVSMLTKYGVLEYIKKIFHTFSDEKKFVAYHQILGAIRDMEYNRADDAYKHIAANHLTILNWLLEECQLSPFMWYGPPEDGLSIVSIMAQHAFSTEILKIIAKASDEDKPKIHEELLVGLDGVDDLNLTENSPYFDIIHILLFSEQAHAKDMLTLIINTGDENLKVMLDYFLEKDLSKSFFKISIEELLEIGIDTILKENQSESTSDEEIPSDVAEDTIDDEKLSDTAIQQLSVQVTQLLKEALFQYNQNYRKRIDPSSPTLFFDPPCKKKKPDSEEKPKDQQMSQANS